VADDQRDERGRFLPGNPGNTTGGRPKGSVSITRLMREALEESGEKEAKRLAKAILRNAAKGNSTAIKEVLDRIDGPVKQQLDVTSNGQTMGVGMFVHLSDDELQREIEAAERDAASEGLPEGP
jgi:hypothetical protein